MTIIMLLLLSITKVLFGPKRTRDPSFLFQNLGSYNINKNLSAGSMSVQCRSKGRSRENCATLPKFFFIPKVKTDMYKMLKDKISSPSRITQRFAESDNLHVSILF